MTARSALSGDRIPSVHTSPTSPHGKDSRRVTPRDSRVPSRVAAASSDSGCLGTQEFTSVAPTPGIYLAHFGRLGAVETLAKGYPPEVGAVKPARSDGSFCGRGWA